MQSIELIQEVTQLHAELCSALADKTRLLILYALGDQACNVTELTQRLDLPQPTVSRHLKVLRNAGLVRASRQGMTTIYMLSDNRIVDVLDLLRSILRDRIQYRAGLIE